jgi:hypothetical protein
LLQSLADFRDAFNNPQTATNKLDFVDHLRCPSLS